ncbi:MAG: transporter substrate-binding domain-containing protein, partial [Leptolyngbyaceae bacterium]|nr:transporter substrate-binding domain-containing protein [Leptolyngbyaceae bacterium]
MATASAMLTLVGITACSSNQESRSSVDDSTATEAPAEEKVLIMATSADYPPYEFYDTASGSSEPIGFDIDIAKAITEELGYTLKIEDMDFNGIVPALQAERVDFAMAGMTPTEERKQSVDFSQVYYDAKNTIISLDGAGFASYEDLEGKKVGVQLGSIQEGEAKEKAETISMTIEPRNKISELVQEIKAGRLDAAIVEDTVAKGYVANNDDLVFTTIEGDGESGSAIAFPKGSPLVEEFDAVLTDLIESGELDGMIQIWFEDYYNQQ